MCTRCSHSVHSRCYGLRNVANYRSTTCGSPPQPRAPSPSPSPAHTSTMSDKAFNILQWNVNVIGNKQTELSILLEKHSVKVAAIQESRHNRDVPTSRTTPQYDRIDAYAQAEAYCVLSITQSTSLASHCQQRLRMTHT